MRLMRFGDDTLLLPLLPERARSPRGESSPFQTFLCRYALRASYDTKKEEKKKRKILNMRILPRRLCLSCASPWHTLPGLLFFQ